ncbi:MAG: hypothetical protein GXO75_04390 [Calditrichaeota bacterium]|nr:hypothetical protein [Calditrichota bacterium]
MDLELLRSGIDKLDIEVLRLLNKRANLAAQIGEIKNELNMSIINIEREHEILENIVANNAGPLSDQDVRNIYVEIIRACRDLQKAR